MYSYSQRLGATIAAILLSACSTTTRDVPSLASLLSEATGQNGRACVRQRDIRGYGVLKHNMISIDGLRRYYLATVRPGCTDLQGSIAVMFASNYFELCGQSMNRIITQDNHCTIGQMFEFETRDAAFSAYNATVEKRAQLEREAQNP